MNALGGQELLGVATTTVPRREEAYVPAAVWQQLEQRAAELKLRTCLFHPRDVLWRQELVHGWVREEGAWRRRLLPLPDVVYENVYVHLSGRPFVRRMRRRFEKRGIPLFNESLGDKGELADWLRAYPELWRHHPETLRARTPADVTGLLERKGIVYVKPVFGSAGAGILEIRRLGEKEFRLRAAKYGPQRRPLDRELCGGELPAFLRRELRRTSFIVQEDCGLLHIDACKIDLRTHLQRNADGEWELVALLVKQGSPRSIVSNYHAGGRVHEWSWLERRVSRRRLPSAGEVAALSERIARAYGDKAPRLGSIGLDIGIDREGGLWLLDVNSRPGRNILTAEQKERCQHLNAEFAAFLLGK